MADANADDRAALSRAAAAARRHVPTSRGEVVALGARLFPEGSRGRDLLRFARLSVHDGELYAELVRQHWAAWGKVSVRSYQWWDRGQGPTRRDREKRRRAARRATAPLTIGIVLLGSDGGERSAVTLRTLRKQTWHHWRLAAPGPIAGEGANNARIVVVDTAAPMIDRLSALDLAPRDLVVVLEAGDRLTPGALFQIAKRAWRLPASTSFTGTTT